MIPAIRRISALLLGLLFLQLTLLGNGEACRAHESSRAHASMGTMHGASARHAGAPTSHDGCDAEQAAGTCASMPSCATALGTPASVVALGQLPPMDQAIPEPVSIHSQPASGPDVPPPRG